MKIGIYGGTFNPPHLGHLTAAKTAVEVLGLDQLMLIPAAVPPHKELPEETPAAEHRLAMVEKMADAMRLPKVTEVSTIELERQGKSYTSDTLAEIHRQFPEAELWLLVGTDMFLTLHLWHDPAAILKLARVCAFGRAQQDGEDLFAPQQKYLEQTFGAEITVLHLPDLVEVSSTQLREQLEEGKGGDNLLPAVYGYILMNGLYGTSADLRLLALPELRACSCSMMRAKRVPHVMGVEEEAVRLAQRWGADPELARHAGILHDCTKYLELERQLELCAQYGVELDELERTAVKLLHAKTGACIARGVFGEPDVVYEAIFWHTTAKEDMTILDKILYLADYIEPNRDFNGVGRLRELAYQDLDKALLLGIEATITEMEERQLPIHKKTMLARDWLYQQGVTTEE
ncbi:MAG: nicotinate (nicotinamide) nucleotide adenylyltransferase [Lawsonibacter sp.]|nr:nicotinate (nicotinamide) nucleotide adenylyltransferase [Lawsonibacter sp.]